MVKKSPASLKKVQQLKLMAARNDPKLKLGERWRFDEFAVLLVQTDEDPTEYEETGKVICVNCKTLFTKDSGSHFNRHLSLCKKLPKKRTNDGVAKENVGNMTSSASQPSMKMRKIDDFNWKKLKTSEVAATTQAIARYCVKSGKSYNHCSSVEMKTFVLDLFNVVSTGYGEDVKKQLPSRMTIQRRSEEIAQELIDRAHEFLKPFIKEGRVNLLTDHGKHVVNYLSLYASLIDDNFALQIVPLGFIPATDGKSGLETAKIIISRLEHYGWTTDEIKACSVTADGALSTLSGYFSNYVRCVSHSINLVSANGCEPLAFQRKVLSGDDISRLEVVKNVLNSAQCLSNAIRANNEICEALPKLPSLPGETRWLSSLKCLADIYELEEDLEKVDQKLNISGSKAFLSIVRENKKTGKSIILVFGELLHYSKAFQSQSRITTHLVLPAYKRIEEKWNAFKEGKFDGIDTDIIDPDCVVSLAKSGLAAFQKYYRELSENSHLNFAATLMSPQHKQMKNFDKSEIEKGRKFLADLLPIEESVARQSTEKKKHDVVSSLSKLLADKPELDDSRNDELKRYLTEPVDDNSDETLEEYWIRKKKDYPQLYDVATRIFSVVHSEAVCETCFSTAGFMLDKRRTRLQYSRAEKIVVGSQIAKKFPSWI